LASRLNSDLASAKSACPGASTNDFPRLDFPVFQTVL
jgi:hypothetical protein